MSDALLYWEAFAGLPPVTGFATPDVRGVAAAANYVCDFDAAADEYLIYQGIMPRNYKANGLTVYLKYAMSSATSGNVVLSAAFERGDVTQDLDADGFAAALTTTSAVAGTSGLTVIASIAFTNAQIDGILAGDPMRLRVGRLGTNVGDTATGDLELTDVWIEQT